MKKLLLSLLFVSASASAHFIDGNDLNNRIHGDVGPRNFALGYLAGVADAMDGSTHCIPDGVTLGQLRELMTRFMNKNVSNRHWDASLLTMMMLQETYPCKKGKKS